MKTGIAFSKTQFCYDTSKYAPLFNIARYNGNDFWEVARFVVRIMEMGDASYKQDEIYIASALVNGKANIYMKNINGENVLDYFVTEGQKYYTFYVKATTNNSQVVAHVEYSNNIGFLQAVPYEYFDQSRPAKYFTVDGQSHSGGTGGSPTPDPKPDAPTDPSLVHPEIKLVQSDAWLNGAGEVFGDNGKNEYDVVKFTAVGNTTYSYNYGNCINPAGSVIVFKNSYGNTSSIQKADIPTNGQFTTPENCVEVIMSIKHGSKDKLNMHIGTDIVTPDPEEPETPPVTPEDPTYPTITLVQSDAWINGAGEIFGDNGKNEYDIVKFTATGNTDYSYNYADCINRAGSRIVFKLANGNTSSIEKANIPNNGVFTTPSDCVEVFMSIKYGTKDILNMRTGSYPSAPPEEPDPEPEQPPQPPVNPDEPTYPEITLVQSDAWIDGTGAVFNDGGKNEYDVVKFTAVGNTTYSYNYGNCINPAGSAIVFKLSNDNTESLQKSNIPTNGLFTTPADCVEVIMSIKHGSKDKLNMHIGTDIVTPDPEEPETPPVTPEDPTYPTITLVQSDAWINGAGEIFGDNGKNEYDIVKFTATGNTDYSYNYADCINRAGSRIVFKLANGNTSSIEKANIPNNGVFTTPSDCVEVFMSIKYGTKDILNMRTGSYPSAPPEEPDPEPEQPPQPPVNPDEPTYPEITLVQSDAWIDGTGAVFNDGGKNEYDVVKFTAVGNTTYSYNYADCINRAGSVIVFKFSYGNTESLQKNAIPNNGVFTTPADCVEVMMSIKYGSKDSLNMRTGSYPSTPPEEPDPTPTPTPDPTPSTPTITLVQSDAWLNGAGEVFGDNGKNEYDVVKFTAVQNTTYSYNYADCINPAGSVIVFKLSYGNTSSIQKADIPTNGEFTTPADCVEVIMCIKHGSKDSLNMHTVV